MKNCTIITIVMVLALPGRVSCAQVDTEVAEPRQQKLVWGGEVMCDDSLLRDLGVPAEGALTSR